jgi:anthranilate synthase component 1
MPSLSLASLPDLAALRAAWPKQFPLLLQSAADSGWDMLFWSEAQLNTWPLAEAQAFWQAFAAAEGSLLPVALSDAEQRLPFRGGWFFYLGYELLHSLEPTVAIAAHQDDFPVAALGRAPAAVLVERNTQQAWLVAEDDSALVKLQQLLDMPCPAPSFAPPTIETAEEDDPRQFLDGVNAIKRYIYEGDVFQVNLSRAWEVRLGEGCSSDQIYASLRRANPAPFAGLLDMGRWQIISSSPERLLALRDGKASTRPIAGTHPRSPDPAEDAQLKARLAASLKERAEHVMLIDLERNDLGRICRPGSVKVEELMAVASYTYVHHIESTVSGMVRADVGPVAALRAMFPGGTITGCPKVRTMQIIAELESSPRRAYTGSIGYLNHDGSLDSNILIRSFMQDGQTLRFRAGAGIVADSDPERELQETRAKARGLLRALGLPT